MLKYLEKYKFELGAFILTTAAILMNSYFFGISDHTYKIPFFRTFIDPSYYDRDITIAMRRFYVSFFDFVIYPFYKIAGLENAYRILHFSFLAIFFLSLYTLTVKISQRKILGLASLMALFYPKVVNGAILTFDYLLEERFAASSLLLFSVFQAVQGNAIGAGVVFGLAANIHLVSAANFFLFILSYYFLLFFNTPAEQRNGVLKSLRQFCFFALLTALPLLIKKLTSDGGDLRVFIDPEWMKMIKLRSGYHFFLSGPFTASQPIYGFLILFIFFKLKTFKDDRPLFLVYTASFMAMTAGIILAVSFSTFFPSLIGLNLSFFRTDYLFVLLTYLAAAYIFIRLFDSCRYLGLFSAVLFSWIPMKAQIIALTLTGVFLLMQKKTSSGPRPASFKFSEIIFILVLFLISAAIKKEFRTPFAPYDSANKDAQIWVKNHTEKNALLLAPPDEEDFRIYSERATFGTWKDWTYSILNRKFAYEMYGRLNDVCGISLETCRSEEGCVEQCRKKYSALSETELKNLTRKYHFDLIIRNKRYPLNMQKLYENQKYLIYQSPGNNP